MAAGGLDPALRDGKPQIGCDPRAALRLPWAIVDSSLREDVFCCGPALGPVQGVDRVCGQIYVEGIRSKDKLHALFMTAIG